MIITRQIINDKLRIMNVIISTIVKSQIKFRGNFVLIIFADVKNSIDLSLPTV